MNGISETNSDISDKYSAQRLTQLTTRTIRKDTRFAVRKSTTPSDIIDTTASANDTKGYKICDTKIHDAQRYQQHN